MKKSTLYGTIGITLCLTIILASRYTKPKTKIETDPVATITEPQEIRAPHKPSTTAKLVRISAPLRENLPGRASDEGDAVDDDSEPDGYSELARKALENMDIKYERTFNEINNPERRAQAIKTFADFKTKGYMEESAEELDTIFKTIESPAYQGTDFKHLDFTPSQTSDILNKEYTYKGFAYEEDPSSNLNQKMQHLMRSYQNGNYKLVISEDSTSGGGRFSNKEYVTSHVQGYPAIFYKSKAKDYPGSLYKLRVSNEKYNYMFYLDTENLDPQSAEKELNRVATELFNANRIK